MGEPRAQQTLSYVIDVRPRVLGLPNPHYRNTLNNLAVASLLKTTSRSETILYTEKSLALHLEATGLGNASALESYRCLGLILRDQEKAKEAENVFLHNLVGQEKL
jgi:hypothetical protein